MTRTKKAAKENSKTKTWQVKGMPAARKTAGIGRRLVNAALNDTGSDDDIPPPKKAKAAVAVHDEAKSAPVSSDSHKIEAEIINVEAPAKRGRGRPPKALALAGRAH